MARRNKAKQKRRRQKSDRKRGRESKGIPIVNVEWQFHREDQKVTFNNADDPEVLKALQEQSQRESLARGIEMKTGVPFDEALHMVEEELFRICKDQDRVRLTWKYDGKNDSLILHGASKDHFLNVLRDEEGRRVLVDEIERNSSDELSREKIELLVDDWERHAMFEKLSSQSPAAAIGMSMMGFGPGIPDPDLKLTSQELSRRNYIKVMECLYVGSRGQSQQFATRHAFPAVDDKEFRASRVKDNSLAWALMRSAKLFHISPQTYAEFHVAADDATCQGSVELSADAFWNDIDLTKDLALKHAEFLHDANTNGPEWPEHFPFERMFISYGAGYWDDPDRVRWLWTLRGSNIPDGFLQAGVIGHLVSAAGDVWEFMMIEYENGDRSWSTERIRTAERGWVKRFSVSAWTVPALINMINENRAYIIERKPLPHEKRAHKDNRKKMGLKMKNQVGHVPPPFFTIKVQDSTIHERAPDLVRQGMPRHLSYKTDVRAHERVYVRRGPLPMPEEERARFKALEYRIYEQRQMSDDDRRRLYKRGHAQKRPNEWVAVKHVWIDEHMNSNDPNLEYVPALRVVPGEKQAAIKVEAKPVKATESGR